MAQAWGRRKNDFALSEPAAKEWLNVLQDVRLKVFERVVGGPPIGTGVLRQISFDEEIEASLRHSLRERLLDDGTITQLVEGLKNDNLLERPQFGEKWQFRKKAGDAQSAP